MTILQYRAWGTKLVHTPTLVFLLCWIAGCTDSPPSPSAMKHGEPRLPPTGEADLERQIAAFCGDCHAVPRPESFPRDRWHEEVWIGYQQYARSGRDDLIPPPIADVVRYYRARAPERLTFSLPSDSGKVPPAKFRVVDVSWPGRVPVSPAVSGLLFHSLGSSDTPHLIVSDMKTGEISAINLRAVPVVSKTLAVLQFPCRVEPCDLDGSGRAGFVVAELGSFLAMDHTEGKVIWLHSHPHFDTFEKRVLAQGLGRVADVRVADFNRDGKLDILVAEFGHYRTGGILLLLNEGVRDNGEIHFSQLRLDHRPGTIHTPVADFNGDGRPDFVALISNEWEAVELFLNFGDKKFLTRPLWHAPDLAFGSSGIELVDLDGDSDLDILYTNGDSFDNLYANPWHGIQWLENLSEQTPGKFQYHRLIDLPGAYRAVAGDIDGDRDLDIIVSAWLPRRVFPKKLRQMPLPSILLLEQTEARQFVCHTVEKSWPQFPVLVLADLDADGDLDIVVGRHGGLDNPVGASEPPLRIFWNEGATSLPH